MTPSLVVDAKLARPRLPRVLRRRRLLDLLETGIRDHPVTILSAGAGYGKTTLLASLADATANDVLWYSLGPEDSDLAVFLWHVAAALQKQNRRFGAGLTAFLREGQLDNRAATQAAGALLNDISRIRRTMIFVLDDFHLVSGNRHVIQCLSTVLENNKGGVRFVLASRAEPPLPLGRLRARRQVLEIGPADLAFTDAELRSLLEDIYDRSPSPEDLEFVTRFTEGWVTPVHLALQMSPNAPDLAQALARVTRSRSALYDYLAEEVLNLQTPETRRFMLLSSVFEDFDPEQIAGLVDEPAIDDRLKDLAKRSLIQEFAGRDTTVYRYHSLLREFLLRRFREELPVDVRDALHEKAAQQFLQRGDLVNAARQHALRDDPAGLARFLRDNALRLIDLGHYQALLTWLEALPAEHLNTDPWLRLRLGDARHYVGDWPGAEIDYELALVRFESAGDATGRAWASLGLARIWNLRGQADRAAETGEKALAGIETGTDDERAELRMRLLQVLSGAKFYLGRYGEALDLLDRLEVLTRGNPDRQAALWNNRAVIWASRGNFREAAQAFERGLERPGARRSPRAPLHLTNLAHLLFLMGDSERARPLFQEALELARGFRNRGQTLSSLIGLARLHHRQGNLDKSLELIEETEILNASLKAPLIESEALELRAQILSDSGQFSAARETLNQALLAYGASGRDANWLIYRVGAAVIDLRSGRTPEAHRALMELLPVAREMEAFYPRAMLLFYLGDSARRMELPDAIDALSESLTLSGDLGYEAFLRGEMRRDFAPFEFLLRAGRETGTIAQLATGAGAAIEQTFLTMIDDEGLPADAVLAVLNVLADIGGPAAHHRIAAAEWARDDRWKRACRATLEALERRYPDLKSAGRTTTGGLYLTTLGTFSLAGPDGEIPPSVWRSQRALSIFIYCAIRAGRGVSRERLIELFWPGKSLKMAEKNFHPTLSYARRALRDYVDGPVFTMTNGLYHLDPDLSITVDLRGFEALAAEARSAGTKARKIRCYTEALALYRGDFLEGLYESWVEETRNQLSVRYEAVLGEAARLFYDQKDYRQAAELFSRLVARNPYQEEIHLKLMMCYHKLSDRNSIREQYDKLCRVLKEDLKVAPLPDTTRTFESLITSL